MNFIVTKSKEAGLLHRGKQTPTKLNFMNPYIIIIILKNHTNALKGNQMD